MLISPQTLYTGIVSREALATVCESLGIDPTDVTYVEIDGSEFTALAEHVSDSTTPEA